MKFSSFNCGKEVNMLIKMADLFELRRYNDQIMVKEKGNEEKKVTTKKRNDTRKGH